MIYKGNHHILSGPALTLEAPKPLQSPNTHKMLAKACNSYNTNCVYSTVSSCISRQTKFTNLGLGLQLRSKLKPIPYLFCLLNFSLIFLVWEFHISSDFCRDEEFNQPNFLYSFIFWNQSCEWTKWREFITLGWDTIWNFTRWKESLLWWTGYSDVSWSSQGVDSIGSIFI